LYFTATAIYNLYFHPLAGFPGPKLAAVSDIFYAKTFAGGYATQTLRALHEKYGDVVRWAPDELSFSSSAAWKDIYNPRKDTFLKDPKFYITDDQFKAPHIVNLIDVEKHVQAKKMLAHAFSPKALLEQEDVVLKYADMFMEAILDESQKGPVNLTKCYNWVTFDVLGELCFTESFGSTKARSMDTWTSNILALVAYIAYDNVAYRISPMIEKFLPYLAPPKIRKGMKDSVIGSKAKILAREKRGEPERKDFCSYIFRLRDEMKLSEWEMAAYSSAMIIAGSETTATALCALTHWLLKTPVVYSKLKEEVRSRFKSSCEITSQSATFPYLTAVIHEALRIFPPVPNGQSRIVPKNGAMVAGMFIPGGTTVAVHPFAATHTSNNFKDSDEFRPERWLDPDCTDDLGASNPFLIGPRACLGQNMAWMELRIMIAKVILTFDFEAVGESIDWGRDIETMPLWKKPALWTKVTPRKVS